MNKLPTEESFLKDVATHRLVVVYDDGVHRHLTFRRPGTVCMGFELITWPGYLCYCGDMGCFVFSRINDMLKFFRVPEKPGGVLEINLGYWAEKCEAVDRCDGLTEYSADIFRERIGERLDDSDDAPPGLRQAVEESILSRADDGEREARGAVEAFEFEGFTFHDFWETNLHEYTYRFIWCCYAMVWGIKQYDSNKATP